VTTSIGIALYPFNGEDAKTLLKQADSAMYSAKQAGKNCYELYHNISLAAKLSADQE
jgi:diguanylate cyclase (GGDEF)-like protein